MSIWKLRPNSKKLCSCCASVASHKMEIRTSWFRGDDEVYLVCDEHKALVDSQRFEDFYHDFAMTKAQRSGKRAQLKEPE